MDDYCAAPKCMERRGKSSTVEFFEFPTDRNLRKLWIKATNEAGFSPQPGSKLCSLHFEGNDFKKKKGKKELKDKAVPCIFDGKKRKVTDELDKKESEVKKKKTAEMLPVKNLKRKALDLSMFDTDSESESEPEAESGRIRQIKEEAIELPTDVNNSLSGDSSYQFVIVSNDNNLAQTERHVTIIKKEMEQVEECVEETDTSNTNILSSVLQKVSGENVNDLVHALKQAANKKSNPDSKIKARRTGTFLLVNKQVFDEQNVVDDPKNLFVTNKKNQTNNMSVQQNKISENKKGTQKKVLNETGGKSVDSDDLVEITTVLEEEEIEDLEEGIIRLDDKMVESELTNPEKECKSKVNGRHTNHLCASVLAKNKQLTDFNLKLRKKIKSIQQRCRRRDERLKKLKQLLSLLVQKYGKGVYDLRQLLGITENTKVVEELSESE